MWLDLPEELKKDNVSYNQFKNMLYKYLLKNQCDELNVNNQCDDLYQTCLDNILINNI